MKEYTPEEIAKFAAMFDRCITTKNPQIKTAFRELLVIIALTDDVPASGGIFTSLISRMNRVESEVDRLCYYIQQSNIEKDRWLEKYQGGWHQDIQGRYATASEEKWFREHIGRPILKPKK